MRTKKRPGCVLVVEDDGRSLRGLCRLLELHGYHAVPASTVAEAAELDRSSPCDVVLSDLQLADGSGLDLMRTIRARRGGDGVCGVAISGAVGEEQEREAKAAGFTAFLSKPLAFDDVLDAIEKVCPASSPAAGRRAG